MADMTAQDIKDALRKRHPAYEPGFQGVGRWTCLEEWQGIDLLALDAWRSGDVVAYEIKVSRSDYRQELLNPQKRAQGVALSTRFYFATPAGLLTPDERAWEEPDWVPEDFIRQRCTNPQCSERFQRRGWYKRAPKPRGLKLRGTSREGVSVRLGYIVDKGVHPGGGTYTHHIAVEACCAVCRGYGTTTRSRVELVAPTLWIPRDVGLVVVGPRGCSVLKEAPRRKVTEPIIPWPHLGYRRVDGRTPRRRQISEEDYSRLERQQINILARWVSARPDPRHLERRGEPIGLCAEEPEPELPDNVWLGGELATARPAANDEPLVPPDPSA